MESELNLNLYLVFLYMAEAKPVTKATPRLIQCACGKSVGSSIAKM
jgi:hypothetical protein